MLFGNPSSDWNLGAHCAKLETQESPGAALRSQATEEVLAMTTTTVGRINWSTHAFSVAG